MARVHAEIVVGRGARSRQEWRRRPVLSRALRVAVFAVPILTSFVLAVALSNVLPRITSVATALLWVGVVVAAALLALVVFEPLARRVLPLAALLDLCLVFPDQAPARFAVARIHGRPSDLQRKLQSAREGGDVDEAERMQRVLELVLALAVHDRRTRGHSERVRVFTDMLAAELGVSEDGRTRLRWAAILHDIGKLEVPATTLNKEGAPTEEEWVALHRHPEHGAHLVAPLLPWFAEWGTAVEQHHERFDGTGYPHGLRGEQISLAARIVALADSYEVMTAPRSYKRPMSVVAAREELVRVAGTQLDPKVVRAFLNISVGRLWRTVGFGAWVAQFPLMARLTSAMSGWAAPTLSAVTAATVLTLGALAGGTGQDHVFAAAGASPPVAVTIGQPFAGDGRGGPDDGAGDPSLVRRAQAAGTQAPAPAPAPGAVAAATTSAAQPAPGASSSSAGDGEGARPVAPPACISNCHQNNDASCVTQCHGNHDTGCTTWCFGNNDPACTAHCFGNHDAACRLDCAGVTPPMGVPPGAPGRTGRAGT